jgi:CRISPR-associated endonuclease/helicase Cas3
MHGQPESWLPLWQHLHDAAGVALKLWDEWLPPQVTQRIIQDTGSEGAARTLVAFLAGIHDIGKASPAFAVQVRVLRDEMQQAGLTMPRDLASSERLTMPHGLAGQVFTERWLKDTYSWSHASARSIASVVGGHHGIPPSEDDVRKASQNWARNDDLLGTGAWRDVQNELLDHMAQFTGAHQYLSSASWRTVSKPVLALVQALVVVADWLASNTRLFPIEPFDDRRPLPQPSEPDGVRLEAAWKAVNFPAPWNPEHICSSADEFLQARFDLPTTSVARPVQGAALEAARAMDPAGLLVIEAPMGEGKTEAAMLAAEELASRTGAGGVMLALPTQATSDAMFRRVMAWITHLSAPADHGADLVNDSGKADHAESRRSVFLAHGKAWLNQDFEDLPRANLPVRDVARDVDCSPRKSKSAPGGAYIDGWMRGRRKGVLADFVVGTIDQVLFASLKSRHVALRHLAMARKVVILDEIHSFDAYMNIYLERALEWFGAYGVPVIALSATLPSHLRTRLMDAYKKGRTSATNSPNIASAGRRRRRRSDPPASSAAHDASDSTPAMLNDGHQESPSTVLTYRSAGEIRHVIPPPSDRHLSVTVQTAADEDVTDILSKALVDGGCAMVVRNTVARAQGTYAELKERFTGSNAADVVLLHSRFLANDRKRRELEVVTKLGKPLDDGTNPPGRDRLIVVGTQVVEQSLDIDVDLLITDLAPTDLLLQRMGRLHRHADRHPESRPSPMRIPRAVIVGVEDWSASPPMPDRGSVAVYGEYLLMRAAAQVIDIIGTSGVITLPDDIAPLVESAYGDAVLGPHEWQGAIEHAQYEQRAVQNEKEQKAAVFRLPSPSQGVSALNGLVDGSVGEADVADAHAQVRDTEDSIEVIVVQTDEADQWQIPDWIDEPRSGRALSRRQLPHADQVRIVASSTVRLPASLSRGRRGNQIVDHLEGMMREFDFEAWQENPGLVGQLVLPLDDHGSASLPGCTVHYDKDLGLTVEYAK